MDGGMSWKGRIAFNVFKAINAEVIRLIKMPYVGQIG